MQRAKAPLPRPAVPTTEVEVQLVGVGIFIVVLLVPKRRNVEHHERLQNRADLAERGEAWFVQDARAEVIIEVVTEALQVCAGEKACQRRNERALEVERTKVDPRRS